jgi:hypothetical protein
MADLTLGDTPLIIARCIKEGAERQQCSYILASAFWETNRLMKPVVEAYWLSEDWRKKNLRYYPWHGRGYAQITWERNYRFASEKTGINFIADPDLVLVPENAALILVRGSLEGWFTGKKLSDYISGDHCDYVGARAVINGRDKAAAIAAIAREYDADLAAMGYAGAKPVDRAQRPVLRTGHSGVAVAELQADLASLGYFSGRQDGQFGPLTRAALLAFQADNNLETDGVAGHQTWTAMAQAKPRPMRDIDLDEIDEKSGTAKDALMAARVGDVLGVGGVAGVAAKVAAAGAALEASSGVLDTLTATIVNYWPALLLSGLCVAAWVVLRALAHSTRLRRLRDAREARSLAR